jgi:hypothetical protein
MAPIGVCERIRLCEYKTGKQTITKILQWPEFWWNTLFNVSTTFLHFASAYFFQNFLQKGEQNFEFRSYADQTVFLKFCFYRKTFFDVFIFIEKLDFFFFWKNKFLFKFTFSENWTKLIIPNLIFPIWVFLNSISEILMNFQFNENFKLQIFLVLT